MVLSVYCSKRYRRVDLQEINCRELLWFGGYFHISMGTSAGSKVQGLIVFEQYLKVRRFFTYNERSKAGVKEVKRNPLVRALNRPARSLFQEPCIPPPNLLKCVHSSISAPWANEHLNQDYPLEGRRLTGAPWDAKFQAFPAVGPTSPRGGLFEYVLVTAKTAVAPIILPRLQRIWKQGQLKVKAPDNLPTDYWTSLFVF